MSKQNAILISAKHLKDIQKHFQKIKQRNVMPILNFIKIEVEDGVAKIVKNSLEVFLVYKIPAEGKGSVLVQESVLWNVVSFVTQAEVIKISWDDKNYMIESGELKRKNQLENPKHYPVYKEPKDDVGPIVNIGDITHLSAVIKDEDLPTPASFVFIGGGKAAGCDRFVGHCVDFPKDVKMVLRKEVLLTLPPVEMEIRQSDNYDFFIADNFTYGFSKSELPFTDVSKFFAIPETKGFEIQKGELLKFVDLVNSSAAAKTTTISLEIKDSHMNLASHDDITGLTDVYSMKVIADEDFPESVFLSSQLSQILRAIKYDELTMIPDGNKYVIKCPDDSIGLILKVNPN